MFTFGDIFKYREKDFVYLAQTSDILYAARILPQEVSKDLNREEKKIKDASRVKTMLTNNLYFFVTLTTDEFKDRIAHLGNTQQDESTTTACISLDSSGKLNNFDLRQIKKEIEETYVPQELKELTKDIKIEES